MTGQGIDRRRFLRGLGLGAAAIAAGPVLAACGGGGSGLSGDQGGGGASGGASGAKPTLNVWYHQYGEAGTQQAVQKYAAAYPDAKVTVQWSPGDYDKKAASPC
jgi:multiple sugar transport system substrate-binding protein